MKNQGGGLPAPQREGDTIESVQAMGHAGKLVKSKGRRYPASDICPTTESLFEEIGWASALRIQYIVSKLKSDPFAYSTCLADIKMQDLVKEMINTRGAEGSAIVMEMLVSMERLAQTRYVVVL